jgi:hypothetical protein
MLPMDVVDTLPPEALSNRPLLSMTTRVSSSFRTSGRIATAWRKTGPSLVSFSRPQIVTDG